MPAKENKVPCAIAMLAHVDAGKTTLSEAVLYSAGKIKSPGRVDHGNTAMDTHALERERGITIFSSQSSFRRGDREFFLLDTPGHVDFSAEMERTLQVLDCAVLVISGTDGVQAHTETLWRLIRSYALPCFIFVTKMDLAGAKRSAVMDDLRTHLGDKCMDFTVLPDGEELAMCSEALLEKYMESGCVTEEDIRQLVASAALVPCFFGSGLRHNGIEEFLNALEKYAPRKNYGSEFGARVFKISRDGQGNRISFLKVTGGELKVRSSLRYRVKGEEVEEKINQIRLYSGAKYESCDSVAAGGVCAVLGLSKSFPGMGLGAEKGEVQPLLTPVLSYQLRLSAGTDPMLALPKLKQLEEEDPLLRLRWDSRNREIYVELMGEMQTEILKSLILERFDMAVELSEGRIMYKETIASPVEGVGHFEPLRHYAECHLALEPLPEGAGLQFASACHQDVLDVNWQRLILTHLEEKQHLGVLTGSPITDMKITLIAGRAHLKHTEGGDFRQATYRAVRQGLMSAESVLLEPWYAFRIELPAAHIGRAISDVRAMHGNFESPTDSGEMMVLEGSAPVATIRGYAATLAAYTGGRGRLSCRLEGYKPCHNSAEVIEQIAYEPEADTENTPDSVFCAHGAGFNVKWNEVREHMHIDTGFGKAEAQAEVRPRVNMRNLSIDDKELEAIMVREFGPIRRPQYSAAKSSGSASAPKGESSVKKKEFLIVDGYNVIHGWDDLKALAEDDLDTARHRLMDILSNYRGFTAGELVLVFDAYKIRGNPGSKFDYHSIHVVYTADGETADAYIEKLAHDIGKNYSVRVITSDNLIRVSAMRSGVLRTSVSEFENEVDWVYMQISEVMKKSGVKSHLSSINFEGGGNSV